MCTYNGIKIIQQNIISIQEIQLAIEEEQRKWLNRPVQSGFDYGEWPVVIWNEENSNAELTMMDWGFLPHYLKSVDDVKRFRFGYKAEKGYHPPLTTLNAVGEEMLEKNTFKQSALQRRCLVLSSYFFEWRHMPKIGKKGQLLKATETYPYKVFMPGHEYFFMAGIWSPWLDTQSGETINTFAIVTTAANKLMEQVHNKKKRMPLILGEEDARRWILPDLSAKEITELTKNRITEDALHAYTLEKDFRNSINPEQPFRYAELPDLL